MADYDLQYQDTHIDALLATANELKTAGYIYKGVATPSTNPGTPTERVAYLASEPGTYTNFGGIVIASGLYSLTYASGTWTGTQMQAGSDIEVVQTTGQSTSSVMSQKAVTDEIYNSGYVDTDNVDFSTLTDELWTIDGNGKWQHMTAQFGASSYIIPVTGGHKVYIKAASGYNAIYSLLTSVANMQHNNPVLACSGYDARYVMDIGAETTLITPDDCNYLVVRGKTLTPAILNIAPSVKDELLSPQDVEDMINDDIDVGSEIVDLSSLEAFNVAMNNSHVWNSGIANTFSIFIPVREYKKIKIVANDEQPAIYAMLINNSHPNNSSVTNFATGWTNRYVQEAGTTREIDVPDDAQYLWYFKESASGDLLPSEFIGYYSSTTILKDWKEKGVDIDAIGTPYFAFADFAPIDTTNKPLIYEADNKVNANHIVNAVVYPNGVIIAARSGGSIVKIELDGTETTLLTINGSTDWRGLWMDSNLNVYASPFNGMNQDGKAVNIGNGIYRMPYGSNTFTKVLTLAAGYCIWTFCEDNDGYLYAGNYQVITNNPLLYRSTDKGLTWSQIFDFRGSGLVPSGRHVHSVIFNRYNNALYTIIGEVNEVYKSTDHGVTWKALGVQLVTKGSSMIDTPYGILIGSDGAYFCDIDLLAADDKKHIRVSRAWANTIFAIRQSDISNNIYAFCKIDSAVKSSSYYPQMADVTDTAALDAWIASNPSQKVAWREYNMAMKDVYPEDAVRPQHFMILMSSDWGKTWRIIYREAAGAINADGFWTTGYFRNGECLTGRVLSTNASARDFAKPLVISEGRHKYTSDGIDCEGDIFIVTNTNNFVEAL